MRGNHLRYLKTWWLHSGPFPLPSSCTKSQDRPRRFNMSRKRKAEFDLARQATKIPNPYIQKSHFRIIEDAGPQVYTTVLARTQPLAPPLPTTPPPSTPILITDETEKRKTRTQVPQVLRYSRSYTDCIFAELATPGRFSSTYGHPFEHPHRAACRRRNRFTMPMRPWYPIYSMSRLRPVFFLMLSVLHQSASPLPISLGPSLGQQSRLLCTTRHFGLGLCSTSRTSWGTLPQLRRRRQIHHH